MARRCKGVVLHVRGPRPVASCAGHVRGKGDYCREHANQRLLQDTLAEILVDGWAAHLGGDPIFPNHSGGRNVIPPFDPVQEAQAAREDAAAAKTNDAETAEANLHGLARYRAAAERLKRGGR